MRGKPEYPDLQSTISYSMKESGIAALSEMKKIRDTFRSKSSRLKKCSYGFYCKSVSEIEEALRELDVLKSRFNKVCQDWCVSAPKYGVDFDPCFDTKEERDFWYDEMYQFINEMEVTIKSINKKFLKFKARLDSDSIARKPDSNQKSSRSRKSVIKAEEFPVARIGTAMLLSASYSFSVSTDRKD